MPGELGAEGEKKRSRLQTIFLFVQTHFSNAKPKQMLILQLPLKLMVSEILHHKQIGVFLCVCCVSVRHFQSLLHNRELQVISHTKQPAVQEKAARSVCPKAGPEQQLLITEVQAKRALHSPGVHWELGIVNRLLYTWRTCQSSSICVCVYIIIFYYYFDNMYIFLFCCFGTNN